MSASVLLAELRRRDIHVTALGEELRCSAPAGALTRELRDEIRRHKRELLALLACAQELAEQPRALVPLQPAGTRSPIFGVAGHNGDVFCYRALARSLGEEQPFFGLQPPGLDGEDAPLESVPELAAYFAEQLRSFRAQEPCIVVGYCAGGTVAFELARRLLESGREVRFLGLFGCPYPDYFRRRARPTQRLLRQLARAHKHARALLARPWRERLRYLEEELLERRARLERERLAAADPVLVRRARVEAATLAAVCAYRPRPVPVRMKLFLPGRAWLEAGVQALRWGSVAQQAEHHFGPEASTGDDMLREHARAFAELFTGAAHGAAEDMRVEERPTGSPVAMAAAATG